MKKLVICFLATIVITTFSVSTGFSTSYTVQPLEMLAALGINDSGSVVGTNGSGDSYVIYSNGVYTTVTPGTISGVGARRINNDNQIAGTYNHTSNAFWYDVTGYHELRYPGAVATITAAISNDGRIVGTYADGGSGFWPPYYGFTYNRTTDAYTKFTYLIWDGNTNVESQVKLEGVNSSGTIIGTYTGLDSQWHGFMSSFNGDNFVTLEGMDRPLGINDAGQVVGTNNHLAVLYANGKYTDLGALGFPGCPYDINNKGQIAGWVYSGFAGTQYGFIATPVPLPSAVLLLGSGLLGLAGWRRFRKS